MNLTKKTILALGLIAAASVSFAQNATTSAAPVGLLGQSYSEVRFGVNDLKHISPNLYSLGVSANVPVTPYLDLGAGYDYSWIRGNVKAHGNTVTTGATAYTTFNGVKPFVGAAVGYQWFKATNTSDDQGLWGLAAGVEIPAGLVTITPRVVFADDFKRPVESSQQLNYEVEANYWVTKTAAAFAGVGYSDVYNTNIDSWNYNIGARFKF